MAGPQYMPLNVFGGPHPNASPVPIGEDPLQFFDFFPDTSYTPFHATNFGDNWPTVASKRPRLRHVHGSIADRSSDRLVYTSLNGNRASQPQERQRRSSSLYKALSSIPGFAFSCFKVLSPAAPWEHELSKDDGAKLPHSTTVRYFDYRRQRRRLFIHSTFRWFITALICAVLTGCLSGFSSFVTVLSSTRKYVFNALITGLSLSLGLNLASSLKDYAQMMRWRLLASRYRTLRDFELLMRCDSQAMVFRLIWAARTHGRWLPNGVQVLAVIWLLLNLGLQVSTALLGLSYSIDVSSNYVSLTYGNVSVANLSYIGSFGITPQNGDPAGSETSIDEYVAANSYGISGEQFSIVDTTFDQYMSHGHTIFTDGELFWHRFIDRSPLAYELATASQRTINATATCQSFPVIYGGYAGYHTDNISERWNVTWVDGNGTNNTLVIPDQATGQTTWMSNMTSECGPRCTQIYALQTADNSTVPRPRFWSCESNVSRIDGLDLYVNLPQYRMPDAQARILAGSIGWSGVITASLDGSTSPLQMKQYSVGQWSPAGSITAKEMALLVMRFTAGAIAAMDSIGPRANVTGYGPAQAQVLNVQWKYAASVLGGIPFAQGVVLLTVVMCANKAIIKDPSHLSMARLLRPIVEKLGDQGCLLTGDEIGDQLGNYRVRYGVREPTVGLRSGETGFDVGGTGDDEVIRHLDVLEESAGLGCGGRMPEGKYEGLHTVKEEDEPKESRVKEKSPEAGSRESQQGADKNDRRSTEEGLRWRRKTTARRMSC